jgi:hypothetical protein
MWWVIRQLGEIVDLGLYEDMLSLNIDVIAYV